MLSLPGRNHTTGACWLKRQDGWDGNTDLAASNLVVNSRGDYSQAACIVK